MISAKCHHPYFSRFHNIPREHDFESYQWGLVGIRIWLFCLNVVGREWDVYLLALGGVVDRSEGLLCGCESPSLGLPRVGQDRRWWRDME